MTTEQASNRLSNIAKYVAEIALTKQGSVGGAISSLEQEITTCESYLTKDKMMASINAEEIVIKKLAILYLDGLPGQIHPSALEPT